MSCASREQRLASLLPLQRDGTRAAGRTLSAGAQRTNINLEFLHGPAQRVPVHAQLPRCFALIAPVFFEHGYDKAFLKLTDRFRIEDVAFVHLENECFQLIFHLLPRFRTFTAQESFTEQITDQNYFDGPDDCG